MCVEKSNRMDFPKHSLRVDRWIESTRKCTSKFVICLCVGKGMVERVDVGGRRRGNEERKGEGNHVGFDAVVASVW